MSFASVVAAAVVDEVDMLENILHVKMLAKKKTVVVVVVVAEPLQTKTWVFLSWEKTLLHHH